MQQCFLFVDFSRPIGKLAISLVFFPFLEPCQILALYFQTHSSIVIFAQVFSLFGVLQLTLFDLIMDQPHPYYFVGSLKNVPNSEVSFFGGSSLSSDNSFSVWVLFLKHS